MARLEIDILANLKELYKNLNDAESGIQKFASKAQAIGVGLSAALTLPILAVGRASLRAASEAEETFSKFDVVFRDVAKSAESSFQSLRTEYGLSGLAAKQLLSDTGDLLTGFGFSQDAALDLATQVNKLAVDLASFTNFSGGAEGASQALTKALLGERESVKALGISILEEDVKKQVAINTAKGLTFETERQAKAYATLDIAVAQSQNAIGDYARTSDGFANQQRLLQARIEDLSVSIGSVFIPVANRLTGIFLKITESLNGLSDNAKTTIVVIAGIAAAIGPLLLGIGTAIKLIPILTAGFVSLKAAVIAATGPFGLIAIAIGAAFPLLISLNNELNRTSKIAGEVKADLLGKKIQETNKFLDEQVLKYRKLLPELTEEERINKILVFELQQIRKIRGQSTEAIKAQEDALIKWGVQALQAAKSSTVLAVSVKQTLEEFSKIADIKNEEVFRKWTEEVDNFNKELTETLRLQKGIETAFDSLASKTFVTKGIFDDQGNLTGTQKINNPLKDFEIKDFGIDLGDTAPIQEIADNTVAILQNFNDSIQNGFISSNDVFSTFLDNFRQFRELSETIASDASLEEKLSAIGSQAQLISGAFNTLGGAISRAFGNGNSKLGEFLGNLISFAGKMIAEYYAIAVAASVAGATSSAASTGPAAIFTLPGFIAGALGLVATAFSGIFSGGGRRTGGGNISTGAASQNFTGSGIGFNNQQMDYRFILEGTTLVATLDTTQDRFAKG